MDIHEYQAKKILSDFGVTIPIGGIVYSPENAENKAREIGGSKWVVKAQIHSGARGKAGGIVVCNSPLEVAQATDKLLGNSFMSEISYFEHLIDFVILFTIVFGLTRLFSKASATVKVLKIEPSS